MTYFQSEKENMQKKKKVRELSRATLLEASFKEAPSASK